MTVGNVVMLMSIYLLHWLNPQRQLIVFPGEEILQHVFTNFQRRYVKTRDALGIARSMEACEIDPELANVLMRASRLS